MDLIYTNKAREDLGVLQDFDLDMAFGADENNFECKVPSAAHCCEAGSLLYMEGTEYGGIVDTIESDTEAKEVTYKGRTWHGILGSKVIEPLKDGEDREPAEPSRVPEGYTQLDFIESTGTQYIDTGFVCDCNSKVEAEFVVLDSSDDGAYLYGGGTGTSRIEAYPWFGQIEFNYGSSSPFVGTIYNNKRFYICQNKSAYTLSYLDGSGEWTGEHNVQSFTCAYTMAIFALNRGTVAYPNAGMKLYYFRIYDNDVLVRDYVPCMNPDGEIGLYDVVNDQFYGNSGTGVFYGTVSRKLPDGYTQVEYIESSGTQYIDTGFVPDSNSGIKMKTNVLSVPSRNSWLFGSRNNNATARFEIICISGTVYRFYYGTSNYAFSGLSMTGEMEIVVDGNSATINGATVTASATTFSGSNSLYLFSCHGGAAEDETSYQKLYSCQIYDNGTLVRDYVPCRDASGVLGLYDLVNDEFYSNAGSGTFTAGEDIEPPKEHTATTTLTVYGEDADGNSLVGKYLIISGDANECIQFILDRIGLTDLFSSTVEAAGVNIEAYQFHRFTDAYSGLVKMLASAGLKLHTEAKAGQAVSWAEAIVDYTADEEFDSDLIDFKASKKFHAVNHLICLGSGELENRMVIHLYVDTGGNISQEQTQFDLDEYADVFEYPNAESEEDLIQSGMKELQKLWEPDKLTVDFDDTTDNYDVGDIVGAYDNITCIAVSAAITKKIVTIKNGQINISYKVGE